MPSSNRNIIFAAALATFLLPGSLSCNKSSTRDLELAAPPRQPPVKLDWVGRLRDSAQGELAKLWEADAHQEEASRLAFSPDGSLLVSLSYADKYLRLWDAENGEQLGWQQSWQRPVDLAMDPHGDFFYTADAKGVVKRWPFSRDGIGMSQELAGNAGGATRVAINTSGSVLAVSAWQAPISLWNLQTLSKLKTLPGTERMRGLSFVPGRPLLAGGTHERSVIIWDLAPGWWERWFGDARSEWTIPKVDAESDVGSIAVSFDGALLATGHMDSSITIWDLAAARQKKNFFVRDASTYEVQFSPDGKILASAHQNGSVYLWDAVSAEQRAEIAAHRNGVKAVAFHPSSARLATAGADGSIAVWE